MAIIRPTTVLAAQETNPASQYESIAQAAFAQNDWRYKKVNKPFDVYDPRTYGIVVQSERFVDQQIYDENNNIIQSNFSEVIEFAIRRTLKYYNKIPGDEVIDSLKSVTLLVDVHLSTNTGIPNKYYVLIDAATFDAVPDQGSYVLTTITKRTSIGTLAEEYREYFRVTDKTSRGHRARIAEILRTNGVDVLSAQNVDVAEWIYRVNHGVKDPPGKDAKFNAGSEIYLPRTEPDFTKVILGGQEIELTIGEIVENIDKLTSTLRNYQRDIALSSYVYKTLDIEKQIALLNQFYPRLVSHFRDNGYVVNKFFSNKLRIGVDKDYFLIYIGLHVDGTTTYLNKSLPGAASDSPFNDPRTMNFIAKLAEISLINPQLVTYQDFVRRYVFPEAIRTSKTVEDSVNPDSSLSILEQLADRFNKFPVKSQRVLGEENDILGTPKLMAAIAAQQANSFANAGDAVFQNLTDVAAKLENPSDTACGAATTVFSEVLNKIDYRSLAASALECLLEQVPFDCEDIIVTVANLGAEEEIGFGRLGTAQVGFKGLSGVNQAFKSRMREENWELADEAYNVASNKDFTLYQAKYDFQFYEHLASAYADKSEGEIYLAALKHVLTVHGIDYDSIFQEVCSFFSNPTELIPRGFNLPTLFFPTNLPTVDIDAGFAASMEKAMLDAVVAIIVNMVHGIINTLLNNCIESAQMQDGNGGTNNDLAAAIAGSVGESNLGQTLADIVDSFPGAPPIPDFSGLTGSVDIITGSVDVDFSFGAQTVNSKIQAMQDFFVALKQTFSGFNNLQIIALLEDNASNDVLDQILYMIGNSQGPGPFPYGPEQQFSLRQDIRTRSDVRAMFGVISEYVEIQPIINDLNIIAGKAGCTDLNQFISSRVPLWCKQTDKDNLDGYSGTFTDDSQDVIRDLWCIVIGCPELIPDRTDIFCEDDERTAGGAVSKDPYSFSYMLAHVIKNLFDPVYMAYDSAVLTLPDPFYVESQRTKEIERTTSTDGTITVKFFNYSKLQEEEVEIPLGEAASKVQQSLGLGDLGTSEVTVMNPEFNRLIGTGYVPERGSPDGYYGPYTTALSRYEYDERFPFAAENIFQPDVLPAVKVQEKISELAPFSKYTLGNIDDSLRFFNGVTEDTNEGAISFFLSEPINNGDANQYEQTIMRIDLLPENKYRLQVGKMSLTPATDPPEPALGYSSVHYPVPTFQLTSADPDSAIYDEDYSGVYTFPEKAREVLEYIADRVEPVSGEAVQVKYFSEFMRNIFLNAQRENTPATLAGEESSQIQALDKMSKEVILPDITKQMAFGIGKACANSPMFRFTNDNNAPLMSLVDWAPLPSEEEAECGYDPHILSIDTMVRRVIEEYEYNINCSPLENEISGDGQGRDGMSTLEAASMSGLVMTTLRAYALEQLFRSIFPISAFACNDVLTPIKIRFIVDKVKEKLSEKSKSYYQAFLEQVEKTYAARKKDFSAFGTIEDVIAAGKEIGIEWVYADCAEREYDVYTMREERYVTTPSGVKVSIKDITADSISEQFESFPSAEPPPGGSIGDLFGDEPEEAPRRRQRPPPDPKWETCSIRSPFGNIQGYRRYGSNDECIPGPMPADAVDESTEPEEQHQINVQRGEAFPDYEPCTFDAGNGILADGYRKYGSNDPCTPGEPPTTENDGSFSTTTMEASFQTITPEEIIEAKKASAGVLVDTLNDPNDLVDAVQGKIEESKLLEEFRDSSCDPANPPPVTVPSIPLEEILECRLGFLIEEQLYSLIEKFQDLVTVPSEKSFHDQFLKEGIPLLDVYRPGFDTDNARSRFFGTDNSSVLNITQEELDDQYEIYKDKLEEWEVNKNNILGVIQTVLTLLSWPAIGPAVLGPITALNAAVSSGLINLPVFKQILQEEIDEGETFGDSPLIFYTSKEGVKYRYTNVDIEAASAEFVSSVGNSVENLIRLLSGGILEPLSKKWFNPHPFAPPEEYKEILDTHGSQFQPRDRRFKYDIEVNDDQEEYVFYKDPEGIEGGQGNKKYLPYADEDWDHADLPPVEVADVLPAPFLGSTPEERPLSPLAYIEATPENGMKLLLGILGIAGDINTAALVPRPILADFVNFDEGETAILPSGRERKLILLSDGEDEESPRRGQVILEKYIKTRQLPTAQSVGVDVSSDDFSGERYQQSLATDSAPISLVPVSATQVLSPREAIDTSNRACTEPNLDNLLGKKTSLGGEINTRTEQIWNIEEFESYLKRMQSPPPEAPGIIVPPTPEDERVETYEEVSVGLRMVYVAPPPPLVKSTGPDIIIDGQAKPTPDGQAANNAGHKNFFDSTLPPLYSQEVVDRERSYFEFEAFKVSHFRESEFFADDNRGSGTPAPEIDLDEFVAETDNWEYKERYLQLFPLFSVELPVPWASGVQKKELLEKIYNNVDSSSPSMQKFYKSKFLKNLTSMMKQSPVYNFLFKYCVPGDVVLTFVSLYANMVNELSDEFFDKTKFELKNLFEVLSNGGDYTFETEEEKKRGGNRGEFARAMANYGTEGNTRDPALFDLAVKTPKQIFKGLVEFIDPVISPASKIVKAGHAGKFIPQTMKVLNPGGTPGGVDDKNYFITDVILPAGAISPPVGDFGGIYPTVVRKSFSTLRVNAAPGAPPILENNEMVTFRLRDRLTKGSDEGNSLFDKYLQKVFFKLYNPAKINAQKLYDHYFDPGNEDPELNGRQKNHQDFVVALMNRNVLEMARNLFDQYRADLEVVRAGIVDELRAEGIDEAISILPDFSKNTFRKLRESKDPKVICAREIILGILKGERTVNSNNFIADGGYNLATGDLFAVNPNTGIVESISVSNGGGPTIDWIIWGQVGGTIVIPNPPKPEPVFPGYPIPLPITPIAMSSLPSDVVPYSPAPPHSPLGWAYHAIAAADNLLNTNTELKAIQREQEGMENKKKLHEKLCIDMERISAEERKRRGLE